MKETKKQTTPVAPASNKYKAVDKNKFKACYNDRVPNYEALCSGDAVSFDKASALFKQLKDNNIIIKEK